MSKRNQEECENHSLLYITSVAGSINTIETLRFLPASLSLCIRISYSRLIFLYFILQIWLRLPNLHIFNRMYDMWWDMLACQARQIFRLWMFLCYIDIITIRLWRNITESNYQQRYKYKAKPEYNHIKHKLWLSKKTKTKNKQFSFVLKFMKKRGKRMSRI